MRDRGTCAHVRGPARARGVMLGKACRDRPPWVLCRDREIPCHDRVGSPYVMAWVFSVATGRWTVRAFGITT